MAPRHPRPLVDAAVAEHRRGVRTPIVCQRYGISERTLHRWTRVFVRALAEEAPATAAVQDAVDPCSEALRIVLRSLTDAQRRRALQLVGSQLGLSHDGVTRLVGFGNAAAGADAPPHDSPRRIGVALRRRLPDAPLADEFGQAPWLLVIAPPDQTRFIRNFGLSGVSAAAALVDAGCTDVVALHLGPRARERLGRGGVRLWQGLPGIGARELARRSVQHDLAPWPASLVTLGPPGRLR